MTKARDLSQVPNASLGFKNRIINGDMRIDQRNNGASVSINTVLPTYSVDRFYGQAAGGSGVYTLQRSSVAPAGFSNSLLATVTTPDTSLAAADLYDISQAIEGFNTADLGFGTTNAATITLSFWVRSSVTGTYGGSFSNDAFNRSYPFTYAISAANTWEQKSITIVGDTTGTWAGATNAAGLRIYWGLGAGSTYSGTAGSWSSAGVVTATGATNWMAINGATFYITGVQLEKGSTATSFDYRPYGTELALCRRYYARFGQNTNGTAGDSAALTMAQWSGNSAYAAQWYQVSMRAAPSFSYSANSDFTLLSNGATRTPSSIVQQGASSDRCEIRVDVSVSVTGGDSSWLRISGTNGFMAWDSEL